jgi:hypothetical protein
MQEQFNTKSADHCPTCNQPMEQVHFVGSGAGIAVLHGPPPEGVVARLLDPFVSSLVTNEDGMPVLSAIKENYKYPGLHCKHCRQFIIRYKP